MGERNFELGPGTVYLDDMIYLGNVNDGCISCADLGVTIEEMADEVQQVISYDSAKEASLTGYFITSIESIFEKIRQLGDDHIAKQLCTNKRVVYLAYHAKKYRTRKKNYKRMHKIADDVFRHGTNGWIKL